MPVEGLPTRQITISTDDLAKLNRDPWSSIFKPAQLIIDGQQLNAQIGLRGGHTRNYSKKSYEIRLEAGRTLHWNTEYDDPSMIRNALSFRFFNLIGVPAPKTRHIWLQINDEDHGVYLEIEAVDSMFFARRGIPFRSLIYAVNDSANFSLLDPISKGRKPSLTDGYEFIQSPKGTKLRLISFVKNLNGLNGASLKKFTARKLDVKQYLYWLAGAVLTGNYDGFDQNYALYEHGETGKFRIIPWDYEGTWGRNCYGVPCGSDLVRLQGYNKLTAKLLAYSVYRQQYRMILKHILCRNFTLDVLSPIIERMHSQIAPDIQRDRTRSKSYPVFAAEPLLIRQYISQRRQSIIGQLENWKK